jgi:hypothetical protein
MWRVSWEPLIEHHFEVGASRLHHPGRLQIKQAENLLPYLKMVAQLLLSMIVVTSFLLGLHTLMKSKASFNAFCNAIKNPLLTNVVTLRWLLSYYLIRICLLLITPFFFNHLLIQFNSTIYLFITNTFEVHWSPTTDN